MNQSLTPHYALRLQERTQKQESVLCLGMDPHLDLFPPALRTGKTPLQMIEILLNIATEAAAPHAAVLKPNSAFYEAFGSEGIALLERFCRQWRRSEHLVLLDAKRGDIGSTALAYAHATIGESGLCDAVTVSPYMGSDSLEPFISVGAEYGTGVYILCKTSNPGAAEIQDLTTGDSLLHEEVARMIERLGSSHIDPESQMSHVGAVVGATHPEDIPHLRSQMSAQPLLIPGYGSQGGTAEDIQGAFYPGARGAVVNSSRGILFPDGTQEMGSIDAYGSLISEAAKSAKLDLWSGLQPS